MLESEKAELESKVKELQAATTNGDSPTLASAQSPEKSPKDIVGKTGKTHFSVFSVSLTLKDIGVRGTNHL